MAIDGQVCFHRRVFADPIKSPKYTTGPVGPVNAIRWSSLLSQMALC